MKKVKKLFRTLTSGIVSAAAAAFSAVTAFAADATTPLDGTDSIVSWIDRLKESATQIAIAIIALAVIGVAIVCAVSKNGFEKAKPWIISILVGAAILLFGEGVLLAMF